MPGRCSFPDRSRPPPNRCGPWNLCSAAGLSTTNGEFKMKLGLAVIATAALIGTALPACADEIGVRVGPAGVTVGEGHRDRDVVREREVVRERGDHRDR